MTTTNPIAGRRGAGHNERRRVRVALAAAVIATLCFALPAQAQRVTTVNYTCNIEGAPGQLTARVQAVNGAGVYIDASGFFAGSVPTGEVNFFYEGSLTSVGGRYSFTGTNQYADFVDLTTNDRFRVQMIPQGTQLLMIINPQGPGPVRYVCQQQRAGAAAPSGGAAQPGSTAQPGGQVPQGPSGRGSTLAQLAQAERKDYGIQPTRQLHTGEMHGPTPASIPGGQVLTTQGLVELVQGNRVRFIVFDTLGGAEALPGAVPAAWAAQAGSFTDQVQRQLVQALQQQTAGNKGVPLIFYCLSDQCWMSYNASLRAINAGYTNVLWYRGGLTAWKAAGLPTQRGTGVPQQGNAPTQRTPTQLGR
jgi:PQQ-dependent catabolism-associated CXXCW motif protein